LLALLDLPLELISPSNTIKMNTLVAKSLDLLSRKSYDYTRKQNALILLALDACSCVSRFDVGEQRLD